ncbi:MAG: hypothetical protein H7Y03_11980 [Chitinophagaceae bacterium]|nr:hypothetical protein [Chitinophagaceae bacterium]
MKPTNFSERNQNIRKVMLFTVASVLLAALLVAALIYTPQERDRLDLYKDNTSANTANNVKVIPGDDVDDLKKDLAYLQQLIMKKDERIVQLEDNLNEQRLVSKSPKDNNTVRFQYRNDSIRRENES